MDVKFSKKRSYWLSISILCLGLISSIFFYKQSTEIYKKESIKKTNRFLNDLRNEFLKILDFENTMIVGIDGLYAASKSVEEDEFKLFYKRLLNVSKSETEVSIAVGYAEYENGFNEKNLKLKYTEPYSKTKLISKDFRYLIKRPEIKRSFRKALKNKTSLLSDEIIDGKYKGLRLLVKPIYNSKDEHLGYVFVKVSLAEISKLLTEKSKTVIKLEILEDVGGEIGSDKVIERVNFWGKRFMLLINLNNEYSLRELLLQYIPVFLTFFLTFILSWNAYYLSSSKHRIQEYAEQKTKFFKKAQKAALLNSWTYSPEMDLLEMSVNEHLPGFNNNIKSFSDFLGCVADIDQALFKNSMTTLFKSPKSIEFKFRHLNNENKRLWMNIVAESEYDLNKNLHVYGILQDITSEVEMREKVEKDRSVTIHDSKMVLLGELAGGIAHEVNNPLTMITGYAEKLEVLVLRNDDIDKNELSKTVEKIHLGVERVTKIISSLRVFSRDSGDDDSFEIIKIKEIIKMVFDIAELRLKKEFVEWKLILNGIEDNKIECRPIQISQVLLNVINNAIDAMSELETKKLIIEVSIINNFIVFSISDNGTGISDDIVQKVFNPFFTTKGFGKGTGIGMSVSKGIIENHNGKITVVKSSLGEGACFVITLPEKQFDSQKGEVA